MKNLFSKLVLVIISIFIPATAFAKGGGFGAVMAERSKLLHQMGYEAGYAACLKDAAGIATNDAIIIALCTFILGLVAGYLISICRKKE